MDFHSGITPYGLTLLLAIAVTWCLARRNARAVNIDGSHVDLLIPVTIITGFTGAAILSLAMPADSMIAGDYLRIDLRIRLSGFLASAALALLAYGYFARLPCRRLLDVFALPTLAGLMIQRVGCFFAGCCWGDIVSREPATVLATQVQTLPFLAGISDGVRYPAGTFPYEQHAVLGLIEPGAPESLPVYPVQLYEAALLLVILVLLWRVPWRRLPAGVFAVAVVCSYALARFFIEYLRADGYIVLANLTVVQLQCLMATVVLLPHAIRHRHPWPD